MTRIQTAALAMTVALVAVAGGANAADKMGGMTKMQTTKMASCQKMTKDAMMKDAECVKLSKMHDDSMMKKDSMMSGGAMTKGGAMAPKGAM